MTRRCALVTGGDPADRERGGGPAVWLEHRRGDRDRVRDPLSERHRDADLRDLLELADQARPVGDRGPRERLELEPIDSARRSPSGRWATRTLPVAPA